MLMAAKRNRYLGPEHSLPEASREALARNEKGKALGIDSHKLQRQLKNLKKMIRAAREYHEQKTGTKVIVEEPTRFLPDADI